MDDLDVYFHTNFEVSIKDLKELDLDINEEKWDFVMDPQFNSSDYVYFIGSRLNFRDEDFIKTVHSLSVNVLFMTDSFSKIVFRLKKPELISNRALLSKLWFYYEYPAILFLQEMIGGSFIGASNGGVFVSEYAQYMSDFTVVYRSSEQNVLWINSDTIIVLNKL